jgi:hypothetical protein
MLAHLRTEAYPLYRTQAFPPAGDTTPSYEQHRERIKASRTALASQLSFVERITKS